MVEQKIQAVATLLQQAGTVVAMTGAGISTPSGIPDFRSPQSGLWETADPMTVASIFAFRQDPQRFYEWIRPLAHRLLEAEPNPAHHALATLEKAGKIEGVITQNIDNLHHKAGSKTVYELHGHLRQVTCMRCHQVEAAGPVIDQFFASGDVPHHHCGGVLKPNVILFGEQLPVREYVAAEQAVKEADLVLVIGSSLEVAPASDLPTLALENGARLVIINHEPTHLDTQAEVVIHDDVAEVLPRIAAQTVDMPL